MTTIPRASALCMILGLAVALPCAGQSSSADTTSVLDSVYSTEQANQGTRLFEQQCGLCHFPGEFSGRIFQASWNGRPVGALFTQIRTTMPLDNPGSLSNEQYAAVVAYLLRLNGYPEGERPLPANPDSLGLIRMVPPPDDGPEGR